MAKEVRKAGWLATRMTPMQLISAAAKEPKVHQYQDGQDKGAEITSRMAERHLMINAGKERAAGAIRAAVIARHSPARTARRRACGRTQAPTKSGGVCG